MRKRGWIHERGHGVVWDMTAGVLGGRVIPCLRLCRYRYAPRSITRGWGEAVALVLKRRAQTRVAVGAPAIRQERMHGFLTVDVIDSGDGGHRVGGDANPFMVDSPFTG